VEQRRYGTTSGSSPDLDRVGRQCSHHSNLFGHVDAAGHALQGVWGTNSPKCDLNLDGTINATDQSTQLGNIGVSSGFAELTRNRNRLGYAGYAADSESAERWHVRHRVLESKLGRWTKRDPAGYVDGASLLAYSASAPMRMSDPIGLRSAQVWEAPMDPIEPTPPAWIDPTWPLADKTHLCDICKVMVLIAQSGGCEAGAFAVCAPIVTPLGGFVCGWIFDLVCDLTFGPIPEHYCVKTGYCESGPFVAPPPYWPCSGYADREMCNTCCGNRFPGDDFCRAGCGSLPARPSPPGVFDVPPADYVPPRGVSPFVHLR
jgi:RHS repeat-associated protein